MKTFIQCYEPMTKLDKVETNQNCKFEGRWCFFVTLRKQLAENANKSYHVYKVTVVLHIYMYNKSLVIRIAGHPANKKDKSLVLRLF